MLFRIQVFSYSHCPTTASRIRQELRFQRNHTIVVLAVHNANRAVVVIQIKDPTIRLRSYRIQSHFAVIKVIVRIAPMTELVRNIVPGRPQLSIALRFPIARCEGQVCRSLTRGRPCQAVACGRIDDVDPVLVGVRDYVFVCVDVQGAFQAERRAVAGADVVSCGFGDFGYLPDCPVRLRVGVEFIVDRSVWTGAVRLLIVTDAY